MMIYRRLTYGLFAITISVGLYLKSRYTRLTTLSSKYMGWKKIVFNLFWEFQRRVKYGLVKSNCLVSGNMPPHIS